MKSLSLLNTVLVVLVAAVAAGAAWWMLTTEPHSHATDMQAHHHGHHADEIPRGPHGGRLLSDGSFALEISVFEQGVPPEFRVHAYQDDAPVDPDDVTVTVELRRIDGRIDRFAFTPGDDFLRGDGKVDEPHSFDVRVAAEYRGQRYQWHYENYEGRVQIGEAMAAASRIVTAVAGAQTIRESLTLTGYVQADPARLSRVRARFPGIVTSVKKALGDRVKAGEVLARVQSNESLQTYSLKTPISGLIVRRELQAGEATGDDPLFVIADLSRIWVEFDVFGNNLNRVREGQQVTVETLTGKSVDGRIDWVSPLTAHASQSVKARVELDNPALQLRPGQFVRGRVILAEQPVAIAVALTALQTFRDFDVVFARYGDTYEVRMLTLGRRDDQWVEVLDGLEPGVEYVTGNSYLIKADIEKSGASHDH